MAKYKVAILGCTGMLGAMALDYFAQDKQFDIIATYRNKKAAQGLKKSYPGVNFRLLDAEKASSSDISRSIRGGDWVLNAIGKIKPYIHDYNAREVERAIRVNALFPHLLAKAAEKNGTKIIQIATDCVFSDSKGSNVETDVHDAMDVYGKTKSLGEAYFDNFYNVRCSIIGPERKAHVSLLDWFLSQPKEAELNGFTNHQWNGVTTLQFAKICQGIIKEDIKIDHVLHVVPGNLISKADLLRRFAKEFGRSDIKINDVKAPTAADRTLATNNKRLNSKIWRAAGYAKPPKIEAMAAELASYDFPNDKIMA